MGLLEIKNLCTIQNGFQIEEVICMKGDNICQLHIWQGVDKQDIQCAQKTKFPKNQLLNKEMGKWTNQSLFKGRSLNG
jgi:hypothetical protein